MSSPQRERDGEAATAKKPAGDTRQVDDNQDDMGQDVNTASKPSTNEVRPDELSKTPRR